MIIIYITKWLTGGLGVTRDAEIMGVDSSIHGERAFELACLLSYKPLWERLTNPKVPDRN